MDVFSGLFKSKKNKNTPEENPAFFDDDVTLVPETDCDGDVTISEERTIYQPSDFIITLSIISVHGEGLIVDRPE